LSEQGEGKEVVTVRGGPKKKQWGQGAAKKAKHCVEWENGMKG